MLTEHFTSTHWWLAAAVAGLALATAMATMVEGRRTKLTAAATVVAVTALFTWVGGADDGERQALQLYILAALALALLRLLHAPWIRRQKELKRAGEPMEELTRKQTWLFVASLIGVIAALAFVLGR
ncbi:hypothetical protein H9Y04_34470 [Streptomyces sp. TRM66268-LWL]|uniref:Integral membrane protein n=1 Tax=Streptomyces polyasparticus TaxID=2767826 RepID=A0ABR7SQJ8_9ACTN|nr:hypothetical protein [Streptomyces polyasparticus]MBC9717649.1 hypothetical protein [Streptomyces polyasparticus]